MPTFRDDTVRTESTKAGGIGLLAVGGGATIAVSASAGPSSGIGLPGDGQAAFFVCANRDPSSSAAVEVQAGANLAVQASSDSGNGVAGQSNSGVGITGSTQSNAQSGIFGFNGARGQVPDGLDRPAGGGVWGHTTVEKGSGVIGSVEPGLTQAAGVTGIGVVAGRFFGKVECNGPVEAPRSTISCFDIALAGADCAEEFELASLEPAKPGALMSFDQGGMLRLSNKPYDKNVAGVVSGAGDYKRGILLDRQQGRGNRTALALVGKVYCLADAEHGPIDVGDLLTTSSTPGHAMRAADQERAFGSVIGKAMRSLAEGQGLIPILISLR